jgi:hypothetical protein
MALIIFDDFNRANNNTVGPAVVGGTWTEDNETADNEAIASSEVRIGNGGVGGQIYLDHGSLTRPISLFCKVTKNSATRSARIGFRADTNIIGNHIGLNFGTGDFVLAGNNNGTTTSTTETLTGTFYIWLDSITNGSNVDLKSYISTTTTKPGSPNLTLTNCVDSTGTKAGIFYDSNAGGQFPTFDDFTLLDGSPYTVAVTVGTFVLTGVTTAFAFTRGIIAVVATFIVTGSSTYFKRLRWLGRARSSTSWVNRNKS